MSQLKRRERVRYNGAYIKTHVQHGSWVIMARGTVTKASENGIVYVQWSLDDEPKRENVHNLERCK